MTTVKDYLEQYEWFKGGKEVTPLLIGRYDETRKPITEEEKKETFDELFGEGEILLAFNTLFYFITEADELIRVLISTSFVNERDSRCEVERLKKFNLEELGKLRNLYVYDDEHTKTLNSHSIQQMLVKLDDSCDEIMKPLYLHEDLFKQPFWKKYGNK